MQHKNAAYFKRVEDFIEKYTAKHAVSPTSREIAEGTGLSPATVCRYMKVMRDENVLEYSGIRDVTTKRQREIRVNTSTPIPVLGAVSCGVPKFAEENIEEYVTLPISLFGKGDFFILRANGDSMKGAGIDNGDLVLIRQQCTAEPGDIVVALMGEEATLKRYLPDRKKHKIKLHPENDAYEDIVVDECVIQGVAEYVMKGLKREHL